MNNLPKTIRTFLEQHYEILSVREVDKISSTNGETIKLLLNLDDGNNIECVIIKSVDRNTLCISSQVGCALGCKFCSTGTMGFIRNLSVGEILSQYLYAFSLTGGIDNIVFMGMGEPLQNYDNVTKAIRLLNTKDGANFGIRRITLSTAGIIEGIRKLVNDDLHIKLAVSLNSAIDKKRSTVMPINKSDRLYDLIEVLKEYQKKSNKRFTFEYVMIKGVNIGEEDAKAVMKLAEELHFNLNIIPYNKIKNVSDKLNPHFETPSSNEINVFLKYFEDSNIEIVKRYRKGDDITAACGQLATTKDK